MMLMMRHGDDDGDDDGNDDGMYEMCSTKEAL